jgi:PAS domain S-box-containing protein
MEQAGKTRSQRYGILLPYCLGLSDPSSNTRNLHQARALFDDVCAVEAMELVDSIVRVTDDIELTKTIVTRMLHSFTKALGAKCRPFERGFAVIEALLERNDKINAVLDSLKPLVARMNRDGSVQSVSDGMGEALESLNSLTDHYVTKENLLFPVVERFIEESRCVQLMWAIHDDIRATLRRLPRAILENDVPLAELNRLFGRLFFDMRSMIFREEQVLFPAILHRIPRIVLLGLGEEQYATGQADAAKASFGSDGTIDLLTGNPTVRQLLWIFNNLPVDLTLVDEQDRVVYFNTPPHRIFPRTKSVVGRTVQNCHPPRSVHIVQQILDAFRAGTKREADFRIFVGGRHVRISYMAIHDEDGTYAGTLEISQDITELKKLEGEKRLLDWDRS